MDPKLPERKQKSGDQLAVRDWLAPDELMEGAAEVLFAHAYPAYADSSCDNDVKYVQLVLREQGHVETWPEIVSGAKLFKLATEEDLAALREKGERAQKIADIRALADWLEDNPDVPMPYCVRAQSTVERNSAEGVRRVRELATRFGKKMRDDLDDRTTFEVTFGCGAEVTVIAWHEDGRPAESAPEPIHELLALAPSTDGGVAFAMAKAGAVIDPVARAKAVELTEAVAADPTGLAYSRADDEPDDPAPVTGGRVEPHVGAMTEAGLVDLQGFACCGRGENEQHRTFCPMYVPTGRVEF